MILRSLQWHRTKTMRAVISFWLRYMKQRQEHQVLFLLLFVFYIEKRRYIQARALVLHKRTYFFLYYWHSYAEYVIKLQNCFAKLHQSHRANLQRKIVQAWNTVIQSQHQAQAKLQRVCAIPPMLY